MPVRCGNGSESLESPSSLAVATGCTTTTPSPANLHICTESRAEAAQSYRRSFGFARQPGHIYFDPTRDVLYFGPRKGYMATDSQFRTCMAMCDPDELAAVRRVAVTDSLFWIDDTYRSMTAASLTMDILRIIQQCLPSLEELIFVPREQDEAHGDMLEHTLQRIHDQVITATHTLSEQTQQSWQAPKWRVSSLQALYDSQG